MLPRLIFTIATTVLIGACNQVTFEERVEQVNINNPDKIAVKKRPEAKTKTITNSTNSFSYLSKLKLSSGPCPAHDPASYGVLLKSRTKVIDGNIVCYYNWLKFIEKILGLLLVRLHITQL